MKFFLGLLFVVSICSNLSGDDLIEYDYEVDAYYSNVSAFIDLDRDNNITDAISFSETQIYTDLILNTLNPNIFLLEAAVHPMGIGGLYFRQNHEDMYEKAKVQNFNLVKSVTAGFEEPYSLSFFIGRMMVFKNKKEDHIGNNRAYIGYLVTIGDYSIKDNLAHYDKWYNLEFKLKGTRNKEDRDLDWSFRVGSRIHQNSDFENSLYIGARRSSIDYKKSAWSFVYNSAFSVMAAVNAKTLHLSEMELILEKKWPLSWSEKVSFGLGIGYLYNSGDKYSGALKEEGIDNHQLILRPNLKW
ncbi:hypothetical protein SMGD1_0615 [Sulfurimonas gotlandica GD1]|uniref:Uncharacterized protein n=1 Tax=Sulfurimonas gotlandica (strain DSM 19862 / JCM 16533 / GD1) TaxID=929558 RepID=B6BKT2_SULGG|nr:hypothetical protein [Sulfurimonas gotlandica]EDZ62412.1 hypothetical protein CBGD1_328 [Sulfurimonas gotlandica GD1]EHP29142.1 hypothetical protein SMGD1_0615 [Sulfurimonas gotlandica GD1]